MKKNSSTFSENLSPALSLNVSLLKLIFMLLAATFSSVSAQENPLQAYQAQNGSVHLEWHAQANFTYELQRSVNLRDWEIEGTWPGFDQTVDLTVHNASGGGGGGGTTIPSQYFFISAYSNGHSLISWIGQDGEPYQVYVNLDFHNNSIVPVYSYEVNAAQDYQLVLVATGVAFQSHYPSLTVGALPASEQDYFASLSNVYSALIAEISSNPPSGNSQSAQLSANLGQKQYFRLIIRKHDSDDDGLLNGQEIGFSTDPFHPDTDRDGVSDPWDLKNFTSPIISEFMAVNDSILMDGDGDYPDWIEVSNPTPNSVDLSGWHLSDSPNNLTRWTFPPGVSLAPGQSVIVFASGKTGNDVPAGEFHTGFKLGSDDDDVLLSRPEALLVDAHLNYGVQRMNASAGWGIDQETGLITKLRFFFEATPGALDNSPESCAGFSLAPQIDKNGGVFTNTSFVVNISSPEPQVSLHYTLDGSNPTANSPKVDGSIVVDRTTILRTVAIKPGCIPSSIVSRSYLFEENILGTVTSGNPPIGTQVRPVGYPIQSRDFMGNLTGMIDYEMNAQVVENHFTTLQQELRAVPTISITVPVEDFFESLGGIYANSSVTNTNEDPLGNDWKRLVSVEYIDPVKPGDYKQENCEIAISGGSSRRIATSNKHNLRLIFKAKHSVLGADRLELDRSLFPDSSVEEFKQLLLRNPTQDSWALHWETPSPARAVHIREAWARSMHHLMEPSENIIAHRRWVHLCVNGLHWGIYELGERIDEDFARSYGNRLADYDVIKQNFEEVDGDRTAFIGMLQTCSAAGADPGDATKWQAVTDILDVNNYIDYLIVNMFMHNTDWELNNWRAMRERTPGSRFKFLMWDAEWSMEPALLSEDLTDVTIGPALAFTSLKNHPDFQAAFKARVRKHFDPLNGGAFSVTTSNQYQASLEFQNAINDFQKVVFTESARWGDGWFVDDPNDPNDQPYSFTFSDPNHLPGEPVGDWNRSSSYYRDTFIPQRHSIFLQHLRNKNLAD